MKLKNNQLYKTKDVAGILGVSIVTVKRYIAGGQIPSIKFNGIRRIKGEDILDIINNRAYGQPDQKTEKLLHVQNKKQKY